MLLSSTRGRIRPDLNMVSPYKSSLMTGVMQHALLDVHGNFPRYSREATTSEMLGTMCSLMEGQDQLNLSGELQYLEVPGQARHVTSHPSSNTIPTYKSSLDRQDAGWNLSQEQEAISGRWKPGLRSQGPHKEYQDLLGQATCSKSRHQNDSAF